MKENGQGLPEGEPPGQVSFFPELTFPLSLDSFTMKESWVIKLYFSQIYRRMLRLRYRH